MVTLLSLLLPSAGSAAPYEVEVCTPNAPAGDGLRYGKSDDPGVGNPVNPGPIFLEQCGVGGVAGRIRLGSHGGTVSTGGARFWNLVAPAGARIRTLTLDQSFSHSFPSTGPSFLEWALVRENGTVVLRDTGTASEEERYRDDGRAFFPPNSAPTLAINSRAVEAVLLCASPTGPMTCAGGEFVISFAGLVAEMEDEAPPIVASPVLSGAAVRGTTGVRFSASDEGSGIAAGQLIVDGQRGTSVHDSNGGRCREQQPYQFLAPCKRRVESSLPLDTTALAEGSHTVKVAVVDAAGQEAVSGEIAFNVRNAPTATRRPAIAGAAKFGESLSATPGTWEGAPTSFAYQWLRCPAEVKTAEGAAACTPIAGATSQRYVVVRDDVNHRDLVQVTATNAKGSGSVVSDPVDVVPRPSTRVLPKLTNVKLSRKRFRVGAKPARGRGTVLKFSCSKPGHLTLVIERVRRKKAKPIAKLAAPIKAGRSSVLLNGRIGKRRLSPGKYQVTITVLDAKGNLSEPAKVAFTILRG